MLVKLLSKIDCSFLLYSTTKNCCVSPTTTTRKKNAQNLDGNTIYFLLPHSPPKKGTLLYIWAPYCTYGCHNLYRPYFIFIGTLLYIWAPKSLQTLFHIHWLIYIILRFFFAQKKNVFLTHSRKCLNFTTVFIFAKLIKKGSKC